MSTGTPCKWWFPRSCEPWYSVLTLLCDVFREKKAESSSSSLSSFWLLLSFDFETWGSEALLARLSEMRLAFGTNLLAVSCQQRFVSIPGLMIAYSF